MTDRRRNLLVLLLIAGMLIASAAVIVSKPTRLGLDLQGGVSLIYQGKPTKQSQVTSDSIERAIDIMRKRVDQLGVAEPQIQRSGKDQIDVSLPDVENADEAARQVGTTAQLFFYDWEKNVLGPGCKPAPGDANVTGGPSAGSEAAALSRFDAVERASRCASRDFGGESTRQFFLVDTQAKRVLAGPGESEAEVRGEARQRNAAAARRGEVVTVPQGTVVVRAEQADEDSKPPNRWY